MSFNFKLVGASICALSAAILAGCTSSASAPELADPTPLASPQTIASTNTLVGRAMAAVAHPEAVEAALAILKDGGHAVDAAIAAHAVLGLVEPQSSGIGGGAFMLVYDSKTQDLTVFDGRETAPLTIDENLFLNADGEVMGFLQAWQSGRSVGAPGAVALYEAAHQKFGLSKWSDLFSHAELLAREGFTVTPRLSDILSSQRLRQAIRLDDNIESANYFYPKDLPLQHGDVRDNPAYADLMAAIAKNGARAFYRGAIPQAIERAVLAGEDPGQLTAQDVEDYKVVIREGSCGEFRTFLVCSAPPPSSGGVAVPAIMGLYERFAGPDGLTGKDKLIAFVDAMRLGYSDRDHYVADADHVSVPISDLIDPAYLDERAKQRFAPQEPSVPGDPGAVLRNEPLVDMWGRDATEAAPGTTHLSIVDIHGNAVSMTATVEAPFGSSRWVPEGGFLLNNELTDFARNPRLNGKPLANAPASLKRPRSSMSPTIVLDKDSNELVMVTGSPGGNSIIAYTTKTLLGVLEWGLSAQEAADLPNVIARGDVVTVETGVPDGQAAADALKNAGYEVREREGENSGIHIIVAREDHYEGAADKRREGQAIEIEVDR